MTRVQTDYGERREGERVVFVDRENERHDAEVTQVWSSKLVDLRYGGETANRVPLLQSLNYVPAEGYYFEPRQGE
ncbi:MAG TPA: hypothetical protein VNT60_01010 [Deinococcales bacterium]|nr:hypothetical protein [Deinococcales bacterium]